MAAKSRPIALVKLHRLHVAATATRIEFGHELGGMHWRGEGGPATAKEAIAHRFAVCWNLLEGIPTKALLDGVVRDVFAAVEAGDLATAQRLVAALDERIDWTRGRLHDCGACLQRADAEDSE